MSFIEYGPSSSLEVPSLEPYLSGTAAAVDPASAAQNSGPESVSLTPDALLAYCQARLDSIDGQATGIFNEQELRNSESSAIQGVLATFQGYAAGVTNDKDSCLTMENSLYALIQQVQQTDPGCPELGKLTQTFNDLLQSGSGPSGSLQYIDEATYPPAGTTNTGDGTLSATEVQGYISNLQGCASDLNSNSELQMIQLQSLMSERQTEVQLTTNLVQSLGDQAEQIAENIGH